MKKAFEEGSNNPLTLMEQYEDGVIDMSRKYFFGFEELSVQTAHFLHLTEDRSIFGEIRYIRLASCQNWFY